MKRKKFLEIFILCFMCCMPIGIVLGCNSESEKFSCKMFGSIKTYTPLYASGTEIDKNDNYDRQIEYISCVGPSGCVGVGCGTSCIPTECLYVNMTGESVNGDAEDNYDMSGIVYYYDNVGCVGKDDSMSVGVYNRSTNVMGCNVMPLCDGVYKEKVLNDGTDSVNANVHIFGCTFGETPTEYMDLNNSLPRKYKYGCATFFKEE